MGCVGEKWRLGWSDKRNSARWEKPHRPGDADMNGKGIRQWDRAEAGKPPLTPPHIPRRASPVTNSASNSAASAALSSLSGIPTARCRRVNTTSESRLPDTMPLQGEGLPCVAGLYQIQLIEDRIQTASHGSDVEGRFVLNDLKGSANHVPGRALAFARAPRNAAPSAPFRDECHVGAKEV